MILKNLPLHPFEIDLTKIPVKRVTKIPYIKRTAKKDWTCVGCKSVIRAKSSYMFKYADRDSSEKILRYCLQCTELKSKANLDSTLHNQRRSRFANETMNEIESYYRKHSIFGS